MIHVCSPILRSNNILRINTLCTLTTLLIVPTLIAPVTFSQDKPVAHGLATTTAVDDSYKFEAAGEFQVGACKAYSYKMTSQTWRGAPWTHWLSILVPPDVDHADAAVLFITGGSTSSSQPKADSTEAQLFGVIATMAKTPIAILQQVPNQPLHGGLREDDLIAFTFDKYLNNQGDDWPLLIPMVESVRRAMDTVSTVLTEKSGTAINLWRIKTRLDHLVNRSCRQTRHRDRTDGYRHAQYATANGTAN